MEDTTKASFAFSRLTEINTKRAARYTSAADKVKNVHLKIVFMNYAYQAQQLNADLKRWINAYGIHPFEENESILNSTWTKVRALINFDSEKNIFRACEQLEEESLKSYKMALALSFLPQAALKDVSKQISEIEKIKVRLQELKRNEVYAVYAT
jgi:uncharacterized protein (TIGR02284 family)